MKRIIVGALVLVPLLPGFSMGQTDPLFEGVRNRTKSAFEFRGWPGKSGTLKAGFVFKPEDFSEVAAFTVSQDKKSVAQGISGTETVTVRRTLRLSSGSDRVFVFISAAAQSTDNAHEILATTLSGSQALPRVAWSRGERLGLTVGDLNFVGGNADPADLSKLTKVNFVRNNIVVTLKKQKAAGVNLASLAQKIDRTINVQASFTARQLSVKLPSITTFSPDNATITVNSSTPMTLVASDPQGLEVEFVFDQNLGEAFRDETKDPVETIFESGATPGTATIKLTVVTDALLSASAETQVTITR